MPSPFPGMDPWLEDPGVFPDLHGSLIFLLKEAINAGLPAGYVATTKNIVWVDDVQRREPDVSVFDHDPSRGAGTSTATLPGLSAIGEALPVEVWEEPYLEIVSSKGKRLVTAVEVLSLSNKSEAGAGRKAYLDKHEEFRLGGVNVVEIDLLRGGLHTTAVPRQRLEELTPGFCYHISVLVAGRRPRFFGAALRLADRLPAIGFPLDPDVSPVMVDLQPLLARIYETGRYEILAEYAKAPDPPLTAEQQAWAEGILKAAGLPA